MSDTASTRREFLGLAGAAAALTPPARAQRPSRPNVLFILTDDQRAGTIRALGNPHIWTPNMDRLVRSGVSFRNAYIMGSSAPAVCMPSRAMILTGRSLFRLEKSGAVIPPETETLPEAFRKAGYATFVTGKQHNGPEVIARGFTHGGKLFFGGMSNHLAVPVHDFTLGRSSYPREESRPAKGIFSSQLFTDSAIRFLNEYRGENPYLLWVSYTAPHDPLMAPEDYEAQYEPGLFEVPPNFAPDHAFDNGNLHVRPFQLNQRNVAWPLRREEVPGYIASYYAMITHLDAQIGRLLRAVEARGELANTLVVLTSDNGLALGQHGLMHKQSVYDHALHVPLVISGPGAGRGQTRDGLCYLLDLFPTLCELTGVPQPPTVEGQSLVPAIRNPSARLRDSLYFAHMLTQRGLRDARFKLIEYAVPDKQTGRIDRRTQLFHLINDPLEKNNLAGDPRHSGEFARLRKLMLRWRDQLDDTPQKGSVFWRNYESAGGAR
jgi:arylsulfatase A-like enzyme